METTDTVILIAVSLLLIEVSYLVLKTQKNQLTRRQSNRVLLDTSVLIDGRIVSIAKTGFMGGTLVIPRSVVGELQYLADAADHEKRARARYGLDVVAELQALPGVEVEILQDGAKADEGVDTRLLSLAKKHGASICTLDYNLNKVALVEDIAILNVNELAQSIRMAYLPGERLQLELVQKGQDQHQAVGYLPDGTMVVVEHAFKQMGQAVEVEIIRSLQTAAGRMMFAKLVAHTNAKSGQKKRFDGKNGRRPLTTDKQEPRAPRPQQQPRAKKNTPAKQDPESKLISLIQDS